jgi:hypothetical protein
VLAALVASAPESLSARADDEFDLKVG